MVTSLKERVRVWIQSKIGLPPDVQLLMNEMQRVSDGHHVVLYQASEFPFMLSDHEGGNMTPPFIFRTNEERQAFANGIDVGVQMMGGTTYATYERSLENNDIDEEDSEEIKITHNLPHRKS